MVAEGGLCRAGEGRPWQDPAGQGGAGRKYRHKRGLIPKITFITRITSLFGEPRSAARAARLLAWPTGPLFTLSDRNDVREDAVRSQSDSAKLQVNPHTCRA